VALPDHPSIFVGIDWGMIHAGLAEQIEEFLENVLLIRKSSGRLPARFARPGNK
jgi:hypothetical protein